MEEEEETTRAGLLMLRQKLHQLVEDLHLRQVSE
jgi:hypothetical protein